MPFQLGTWSVLGFASYQWDFLCKFNKVPFGEIKRCQLGSIFSPACLIPLWLWGRGWSLKDTFARREFFFGDKYQQIQARGCFLWPASPEKLSVCRSENCKDLGRFLPDIHWWCSWAGAVSPQCWLYNAVTTPTKLLLGTGQQRASDSTSLPQSSQLHPIHC